MIHELYFSDIDEQISTIFINIGLKKNTARVLTLMLKETDITSRDIERCADLRQPEVSLAITDLSKRKWIQKIRKNTEGKGRPVDIYHLSLPIDDILDNLQSSATESYQKTMGEFERIRLLIKESRNRECA